ncbi:autotransporter-associated beta strand protein/autotransporter passenger strand-loop-strand repeat protein, partial [Pseudomonas corrugata]|uniref:AIDA repeat-containing protein n=1 Tax=Pseudomonas corrugata TaxID=47879 RepID=UPI0028621A8F
MNRTFRLVWNHSQESWMVASEHAKGKTKSGVTGGSRKRALLSLTCVLNMAVLEPALAAYTPLVGSGMTVTGETVDNFGQIIISGGIANSGFITSAGVQHVSSGGLTNSMTIMGGAQRVFFGGVANDTIVQNGVQHLDGGVAFRTTLNSGGSQSIGSGGVLGGSAGVANDTTINSGGEQHLYDGATANVTSINAGLQYIHSGGEAHRTTINSAGEQFVAGLADNTTITSGGTQVIQNGGIANGTIISGSLAAQIVSSGGSANDTNVWNGGAQHVTGVAQRTTIFGGEQIVSAGGSANSTTINSAGELTVLAGGTATSVTQTVGGLTTSTDATVAGTNSLGAFSVDATTHSANNVLLQDRGRLSVLGNGTATDTTVSSGGVLEVTSGGVLAGVTRINYGGEITGDVINHGNLIFNQNSDSVFSGLLSGNGELTKDGANTLTLSGPLTYTGGTQVNAGSLLLQRATLTGAVTIQSGANLGLLGDSSIGGLEGSGTAALGAHDLTLNRASGTSEFAGQLTGTGNLIKDGSYTQTLRGDVAQGFTGSTQVNAGSLMLDGTTLAGAVTIRSGANLGLLGDSSIG